MCIRDRVKAERDAHRGDDGEACEQSQFERADHAVPQQHDGNGQADERQWDADEVDDLVSAAHDCSQSIRVLWSNFSYGRHEYGFQTYVKRIGAMSDQPWHELPSQIADVLRPQLEDVAGEMMHAVATVPAYSRPLEGPFGDGLRAGVHEALRHLVAEIEAGGTVQRPDVYRALGRGEMRAGRSLESLLSAYRIGARVAWRRFASAGVDAGLEPDTLYLLAESIFAYIDVLSAESAEGHALEQSAVAGEAQLRRRRLVRMLVRESPADPDALEAAAADAGWGLPRQLAVVAISGGQR